MTQTHVHPMWNCMLKSSTSTTLRSPEHLREGECDPEKRIPLTHPGYHMTLPVPLQDQNHKLHPSTLEQRTGKRKRSTSPTYPGSSKIIYSESNCTPNCVQCSNYFEPGQPIPNKSNCVLSTLHNAPLSPTLNGSTSFKGKPLISTMYSPVFTPHPLITNAWNLSEKLSLNSEQKTHPNQSPHMGIGPLPLTLLVTPTCLLSPTELKSSKCISATYFNNSQQNANLNTLGSSPLIERLKSECLNVAIYSSLTLTSSMTSKPCTSITTAQPNQAVPQEVVSSTHLTNLLQRNKMNPVRTGTKGYVEEGRTVITSTSAKYASRKDTPATSVRREKALRQLLNSRAKHPSWVRGLMWTDLDLGISRTALWTENALPLPSVPLEEF
jgi:hypothetical protein